MIDFETPDDVKMIEKALDAFVEREVKPRAKKLAYLTENEALRVTPEGLLHPDIVKAIGEIRAASAKAGYYAMHMPESVGGGGVSKVGMYFAWKRLMTHGLGLNLPVLSFVEGPTPLHLHMNEAQQKKWLAPLMRGEITSAFCLTEPQAGSDVSNIQTSAVRKGDEYVLNGTKTFVTNGPYADYLQVFAKTDAAGGLGGVSCFVVPRDTPGLKMGAIQNSILNDGQQCEWILDNAIVPAENRIGEEGEGFYIAIGNIGDTRVTIGGQCVGLAQFSLDAMVAYAQQRQAFGRAIAKQGQIQAMVADSYLDILAAEGILLRTCWLIDKGEDAIRESSASKVFATEMLFRVADRAIQVHGGNGLMHELPLERIFRFARVVRIPEGTSEVQRWTIAKSLGL
ncbi:MAG: acyl-CoA dehydrogenase family protein [Thermoplasmatota archaeon]